MAKDKKDLFEVSFGEREVRSFPFEVEEVRDAENGRSDDFTIKGHAAVFGKWSLDLGGFRERIAKGAFDNVLSRDPHVLHTWDHDTSKTLSSTRNKTLELRSDPQGLRMWSKVAPTSYAADLRVLMERGDIDQSSFAFTVAKDEWNIREEGDQEIVERTIQEVGELFDVTTTAMGAYPTTDSQLATARALSYARSTGRLPDSTPAANDGAAEPQAAGAGNGSPPGNRADSEASPAASEARDKAALLRLKEEARQAQARTEEQITQISKEIRS